MTEQIEAQPVAVPITVGEGRSRPTPVFGTAQPPGGLAGPIRRLAYSLPEHRARHWILLVAADRVDVLEHRVAGAIRGDREDLRRLAAMLARIAAVGGVIVLASRRMRRDG